MLKQPDLFSEVETVVPVSEIPSSAPINTKRLGGQNLRLYDYLLTGQHINIFSKAKEVLRIGYLNSRIADLGKAGIHVDRELITVEYSGSKVQVMDYWMEKK